MVVQALCETTPVVRRMPRSPLTLPDIDAAGGGAERAFHVLAGGFLELRNVRVRFVSPAVTAVDHSGHDWQADCVAWLLRVPRTTARGLSGVCEAPLTPSAGPVLMHTSGRAGAWCGRASTTPRPWWVAHIVSQSTLPKSPIYPYLVK